MKQQLFTIPPLTTYVPVLSSYRTGSVLIVSFGIFSTETLASALYNVSVSCRSSS